MAKSKANKTNKSKKITIVIPALNEEKAIGKVIKEIPIKKLKDLGYKTEIMAVDNGSTDKANKIARRSGASVIVQPVKGYGNAYKAGFAIISSFLSHLTLFLFILL